MQAFFNITGINHPRGSRLQKKFDKEKLEELCRHLANSPAGAEIKCICAVVN